MPKTISIHGGTNWSRGHNIRDPRYVSEQNHIDPARANHNVILVDIPTKEAYEQIFNEARIEYNQKQTREDRKIDDYYDKIKKDKRKNVVYELIVQVGDREDTGYDAQAEKKALLKYAQTWKTRNPNLILVGAYVHADETAGTVHMHIDYIPVAECNRGMRLQNSLDRALRQQGFNFTNRHKTPQTVWMESERESMQKICQELGIDTAINQHKTNGRKHSPTKEYIAERQKLEEELKPLKEELDDYKNCRVAISSVPEPKVNGIGRNKKATLPLEDFTLMSEQAKAYNANKDRIDKLEQLETAFNNAVRKKKKEFDDREKQLKDEKYNVRLKSKQLDKLITDQLRLNDLYATLKEENKKLKIDKNVTESNLKAFRDVLSSMGLEPDEFVKMALSGKFHALDICYDAQDKIQEQINYLIELEKVYKEAKQTGLQLDYSESPTSIKDKIKWAKEKADEWNTERDYYDNDHDISR